MKKPIIMNKMITLETCFQLNKVLNDKKYFGEFVFFIIINNY